MSFLQRFLSNLVNNLRGVTHPWYQLISLRTVYKWLSSYRAHKWKIPKSWKHEGVLREIGCTCEYYKTVYIYENYKTFLTTDAFVRSVVHPHFNEIFASRSSSSPLSRSPKMFFHQELSSTSLCLPKTPPSPHQALLWREWIWKWSEQRRRWSRRVWGHWWDSFYNYKLFYGITSYSFSLLQLSLFHFLYVYIFPLIYLLISMGDESSMKLQNGHCNLRRSQCQDDDEVLKFYEWIWQGIKRHFKNLKKRKSTSRRILTLRYFVDS